MPPNFWLMKSEPHVFAWQQLVNDGTANWDGVRNHLAKKHMQQMKTGDLAFFYHSNQGLEIVGIMRITKEAHPDPTDETGKFVQVTVEPVEPLHAPVSLKTIKATPELSDMPLIHQSRLSVQPVAPQEWESVLRIAGYSRKRSDVT